MNCKGDGDMEKGCLYKAGIAYRLKNYDVVVDQHRPEVIYEDNCARTTAYVYRNNKRRKNSESAFTQLKWDHGTKLDICAKGENAEKVIKIIAEWLYNKKYIEFDEEEFLSQCMRRFADIRAEYNLNEEVLGRAKNNPLLERELVLVMKGCKEQGIKELEKSLPEWEEKNRRNYYWEDGTINVCFTSETIKDITADWVERMCIYYREKCGLLYGKMEQIRHYEEIIRGKEQLAANGDVEAMFFLAEAYEVGRLCVRDREKVREYFQMARHTWAGELAEKYKAWLDKTVQDSGLEMIGRLGREYIEGAFAEMAKKNHDVKLKKEIRWLNEAIEAGDGWAAFTKGNICYYGYGRWGERKQEAYNSYRKAAKSKDSIYALEYGELCFRNGDLKKEVANALVKVLNE